MTSDTSSLQDISEGLVISLLNYIEVLINAFPDGVTQKELAEMVGVTASAVSKIREKIALLCNIEALAYESRLVLQPSMRILETAINIHLRERNYIKALRILSSKYGEHVITNTDVHEWICQKIPLYPLVFSKEESELGAKVILRYIRSFREPKSDEAKIEKATEFIRSLDILGPDGEGFLFSLFLGKKIRQQDFDWPVETASEILTLIGLRDKFFFLGKHLLTQFVSGLSVLKSRKTKEEKELFKRVYEETLDFYLKRIFTIVTDSLKTSVRKRNLPFPGRYESIGTTVSEDLIERVESLPIERDGTESKNIHENQG